MYERGSYVAAHVSPVTDEQVQPNGVDLTLAAVEQQVAPGHIGTDGKEIGERERLEPTDGTYRLEPGSYVARYAETVEIPDGHVGFVYPRSSLMRNSAMLNTAVWDAGYEGTGAGLLRVGHELTVDRGARVAQLVFATAEHDGHYDGSYQGETL